MKRKTLIWVVIIGIVGWFVIDTAMKNKTRPPSLFDYGYTVLDRYEHISNKAKPGRGYDGGTVLFSVDDTMSYATYSRLATEIAKKEKMGEVKFVTDSTCYRILNDELAYDTTQLNNCYTGSIDMRSQLDWRDRLTPSAFQPHPAYWNQ